MILNKEPLRPLSITLEFNAEQAAYLIAWHEVYRSSPEETIAQTIVRSLVDGGVRTASKQAMAAFETQLQREQLGLLTRLGGV